MENNSLDLTYQQLNIKKSTKFKVLKWARTFAMISAWISMVRISSSNYKFLRVQSIYTDNDSWTYFILRPFQVLFKLGTLFRIIEYQIGRVNAGRAKEKKHIPVPHAWLDL